MGHFKKVMGCWVTVSFGSLDSDWQSSFALSRANRILSTELESGQGVFGGQLGVWLWDWSLQSPCILSWIEHYVFPRWSLCNVREASIGKVLKFLAHTDGKLVRWSGEVIWAKQVHLWPLLLVFFPKMLKSLLPCWHITEHLPLLPQPSDPALASSRLYWLKFMVNYQNLCVSGIAAFPWSQMSACDFILILQVLPMSSLRLSFWSQKKQTHTQTNSLEKIM